MHQKLFNLKALGVPRLCSSRGVFFVEPLLREAGTPTKEKLDQASVMLHFRESPLRVRHVTRQYNMYISCLKPTTGKDVLI